ncbi:MULTISPECIES: ankyrin repeat domain-containing protein [Pseudomonas]|uniref:ankyrin repeat domain-containing protein n=1 Tax=Pseudomonas TaxID=286 RepID=UPI001BE58E3E|nr:MULTISPECIES: ankyrin repeat domain-containing protein [Pseudomonas]MBT2342162.1 ankyrin repeat domain-containing protein [Pseudomonas fluorescens]MCD4530007.1 ankyrin repeat domain-containing protein [Pseudomonas sp. C3-2018]
MTSLEKTYGSNASLVRDLYARIEAGDVEFLRAQLNSHPELLVPPRYDLVSYPGLLHHAAERNQVAVCALLADLGMDLDQPTVGSGNATALALAAKNGHLETARWLLEAGADVNGSPLSVATPLITAVTFGQSDTVELLLKYHPDLNRLHAKLNRTALDLAQSWNFPKIYQRLKAQGAISALETVADEEDLPGDAIVEFVSSTAGWVLPKALVPQPDSVSMDFRVSCIANKNDFKLLFTVGLFVAKPRTELFICLPGNWRLPKQGFTSDSPWMFPQALLTVLAEKTLKDAPLTEGQIISKMDEAFVQLNWPSDTDAVMVVDKIWNTTGDAVTEDHQDSVKLYVLAPLKLPKKGQPEGEALITLLEKKRKASWKSIALAAPLQA